MKRHIILGANIFDRIVKCPGSIILGKGDIDHEAIRRKPEADYAGKNGRYIVQVTYYRPATSETSSIGTCVDYVAKMLLRNYALWKYDDKYIQTLKNMYIAPIFDKEDAFDTILDYYVEKTKQASLKREYDNIKKMTMSAYYWLTEMYEANRKKVDGIDHKPGYCNFDTCLQLDTREYNDNPDLEIALYANPDVTFFDRETYSIMADISTAHNDDRNKMFQLKMATYINAVYAQKNGQYRKYVLCIIDAYNDDVRFTYYDNDSIIAEMEPIVTNTLKKVHAIYSQKSEKATDNRCKSSWCQYSCGLKDKCNCTKIRLDFQNEQQFSLKEMYGQYDYKGDRLQNLLFTFKETTIQAKYAGVKDKAIYIEID